MNNTNTKKKISPVQNTKNGKFTIVILIVNIMYTSVFC